MGLFSKNTQRQPQPVQTHPAPGRVSTSTAGSSPKRGLFSRRRSSTSSSDMDARHHQSPTHQTHNSSGGGITGGLFNRNRTNEDPSIAAARDRVMAAEQSERDADHALQMAKQSVHEAREHVKRLELEAEADAKAAAFKQAQARDIGKRAKPLGRKLALFQGRHFTTDS